MSIAGFLPAIVVFSLLVLPGPPQPTADLRPSAVYLSSDGRIMRVFLNPNEQYLLPFEDIEVPAKLRIAVLESEDRYFAYHPGVNPGAIIRAVVQNLVNRRIVSGGSTITMQLARIADPKPRTLIWKIGEAVQALRFELRMTKGQILDQYLAYAPYGGNIIGAGAACRRFFGKSLGSLSWAEAATLAVLPRSPGAVFPSSHDQTLVETRNRLLERLHERGYIDETVLSHATSEPLVMAQIPFPFEAPHLTDYLYYGEGKDSGVTTTSIDLDLQHETERIAAVHADYIHSLGIDNLAAVIAETGSGKIRAYIGSHDYFDVDRSGNVDGVRASRSSGSILKPFLYAAAIDDGIIIPRTLLVDVPTHFGTFHPQNINFAYYGMVTAREALQRSLNVPAVRLISDYGYRDFYLLLKDAGVSTLFRTASDYGLTLILGGAEVTLLDLTSMYRGLGKLGMFTPLQFLDSATDSGSRRVLSSGGSYLTLEMLRDVTRPEEEAWWEQRSGASPVAWKTGTSYGNRDTWAVGVSPQWTIGVWMGNFDGEENVNLRSTSTSAPFLFDLFHVAGGEGGWFEVDGADFRLDTICLDTGYLAGEACERTARLRVPVDAHPLPVCPFHTRVYLDESRTFEVCSRCWDPVDHVAESLLIFPPDAGEYLSERGGLVDRIPEHNPVCPVFGAASGAGAVSILYPRDGGVIYLPRDFDGELQKIAAKAAHRSDEVRVFWYLDDGYVGETRGMHVLEISPSSGNRTLTLVDENGSEARISFEVIVTR